MPNLAFNEEYLSQIPALQELIGLGYTYLSPEVVLTMRGGKTSNVLLETILREQLQKLNRISYKGDVYYFSEPNIQESIEKLKNIRYDGLQRTNEMIYDLITLGTTLEQTVDGSSKSFNFNYIDWNTPANNAFHVVPEFAVERNRSLETARPDIVLFVNGIPLVVIECKSPDIEIEQAISQNIRNQGDGYIPKLFTYAQLVMAVNKNVAQYATTGSPAKFWGVWNELEDKDDDVADIINKGLDIEQKNALFGGAFAPARAHFDMLESKGGRALTAQDKAIHSLCRPDRLITLIYRFTLFDAGIKKIARYQQFFVVRSTMKRINQRDNNGIRAGGVIWHTQGSGKSLTMVMIARSLILDMGATNARMVLVTDRDDLDKQLGNTFDACDFSKERATSGRNLVQHLKNKVGIITTLIHKFDRGWVSEKFADDSSDIFVLVDESHRTNYGSLATRMRQMLPNACFLAFTGTPLLKKQKNSFLKFGNLINPHYPIRQAVKDKAVLPLLYEGRHVEMTQDQAVIDLWFERHTADLNNAEKADLKKKYARAEMLNKADQVIYMRAFDISEHFRANWARTGFKGQLVAPSKAAAVKYHEYLEAIKFVSSQVIISAPDSREGHDEVDEGPIDEVGKFWAKMMTRFGSEDEYTKQVINQFKHSDEPEILIVVDKLLTGFDAPTNTVLYLCRKMRDHTLLQAIARVNRLCEGKDYGYIIDYASVLGALDQALTMYDAFNGFDEEDLVDTIVSVHQEIEQLPQCYSHLWDIFQKIKNELDEEDFEILLANVEVRENFYEQLYRYSKILGIALSTDKFIREIDDGTLQNYKRDLKYFQKLKLSVQRRYAEKIDFRDHEQKIKKLLDVHIHADEVTRLNELVNIFDDQSFDDLKHGQGIDSQRPPAARADTIAHATKKAIHEKMDEDPAFYAKFSKLIQQAIDDFKADRISDLEYLNTVGDIRDDVVSRRHDDVPHSISENHEARAFYGVILPYFIEHEAEKKRVEDICEQTALAIQNVINESWKVDFWANEDAQKFTKNMIDDFLFDVVIAKFDIPLSGNHMDEIITKTMQIAKRQRHAE